MGDTFLLCSDGLTGVVSDTEIGSILANMTPDEAVSVLVDLANLRGGPDNITVIIVKIVHPKLATESNAEAGFLKVNSKKSKFAVSPIVWAIFAGSLFFTVFFYFSGSWQTSILTGIVTSGSFIYLITRLIMGSISGQHVTPNERFGKGPYTRYGCASSAQFAKQLADMLRKLQEALRENWSVDWAQLKALTSHAESATKNRDHSTAIRSYGRAVSFLMDQLRNQTDASSSSVKL